MVKDFGIVNKAEVDVFLELSCFFDDPADVGSLISGSKSSRNIWKFLVHVPLKPGLENFEHYFASVWDECNCAVVWTFFGIAFLWDWNENWPFPVLWPLLSFPNLLAYWVQHFNSIIYQPRQHIKKQRHYFASKSLSSKSYGFSSSHVWMWELDYKECWTSKNWYFRTVVLEKTLNFLLFIYFNWRLVTLQYCGSLTWIWESLGLQRDQTSQP